MLSLLPPARAASTLCAAILVSSTGAQETLRGVEVKERLTPPPPYTSSIGLAGFPETSPGTEQRVALVHHTSSEAAYPGSAVCVILVTDPDAIHKTTSYVGPTGFGKTAMLQESSVGTVVYTAVGAPPGGAGNIHAAEYSLTTETFVREQPWMPMSCSPLVADPHDVAIDSQGRLMGICDWGDSSNPPGAHLYSVPAAPAQFQPQCQEFFPVGGATPVKPNHMTIEEPRPSASTGGNESTGSAATVATAYLVNEDGTLLVLDVVSSGPGFAWSPVGMPLQLLDHNGLWATEAHEISFTDDGRFAAVVASDNSGSLSVLIVIDMSSGSPLQKSATLLDGSGPVPHHHSNHCHVQGTTCHLSTFYGGYRAYDISDPTAPLELHSYQNAGDRVVDVHAFSNGWVALALETAGLVVLESGCPSGDPTSPVGFATVEGNGDSRSLVGTEPSLRYQQIDASLSGPRSNLNRMWFRRDGLLPDNSVYGARNIELELVLSESDLGAATTVFASNHLANTSTVFSRKTVSFSDWTFRPAVPPASFDTTLLFDVSWFYAGACATGNDLLWEVRVWSNDMAGQDYPFDAHTQPLASFGPLLSTSTSLGVGCVAGGQTQPFTLTAGAVNFGTNLNLNATITNSVPGYGGVVLVEPVALGLPWFCGALHALQGPLFPVGPGGGPHFASTFLSHDPSLLGVPFYLQAASFDPSKSFGFVVSNAARIAFPSDPKPPVVGHAFALNATATTATSGFLPGGIIVEFGST
ncbi:MAG: hypothetical protein AAF628_35265 [Planctomycetota bacterium]